MSSLTYIILAAIFSGISFSFVKFSSMRAHPLVANLMFTIPALFVQSAALWYAVKIKGLTPHLPWGGIWTGLIGGLAGGLYIVFLFLAFSNAELIKAAPIIYIGSLAIVVFVGVLFLGESITPVRVVGLGLGAASIFLLVK